jgi:phosphoribosylformylglycinamidine cyclo-ligase
VAVRIKRGSWQIPPLFSLIQDQGGVDADEMFRVFNMGLGMVLICGADRSAELARALPDAVTVGEVVAGPGKPKVIFE